MTSRPIKGYTLVELIVSLAIFAIVMLSATSAYLAFINYNRRAVQYSTLMNSLSYAVDAMARDIRTGVAYSCQSSQLICNSSQAQNGVGTFYFKDASGCAVTYAYSSGEKSLIKDIDNTATGCPDRTTTLISPAVTPGITLSSVKFYVRGEKPNGTGSGTDKQQPMVTIVLQGTTLIVDTGEEVPFSLQTTATARIPDVGN